MSLFIVVWTVLFFLIYLYMGRRLIKPSGLSRNLKRVSWAFLIAIPLTQPVSFYMRLKMADSLVTDIFSWISYIGFGFFSIILAGVLIRDIGLVLSFFIHKVKLLLNKYRKKRESSAVEFDPQRRLFILNTTNIGIFAASILMTGYGVYEARRKSILERINVPIENLPPGLEGFTIAQFSDIHAGNTIKRNFIQSAVDEINELRADTIVFTGDMVDGIVPNLRDDVEPMKDLSAPCGVFYVTGNHEYYVGVEPWVEEMDRIGMTVLLNDNKTILYNKSIIKMAGVTDFRAESILPSHKSDPKMAMGDASTADFNILLAHQPKSIYAAAESGFDLQLSGHTHGGQYIPWSFLVTLDQPYITGLHKYQDTWIYVNRGTGYWGPPIRLGIPSEITLLTLTNAQQGNRTVS